MPNANLLRFCLVSLFACGGTQNQTTQQGPLRGNTAEVHFEPLSGAAFERAATQRKLVVLGIQAGWCHWCHVMNDVTYRDASVVSLIETRFVAVTAEADANPELADRYAEFGWPATIFFAPSGEQVLALRGYREPWIFERILRTLVENLDAGRPLAANLAVPSGRGSTAAPGAASLVELRDHIIRNLDAMYDEAEGGWGTPQKYPFSMPVEHAFFRSIARDEPLWSARARSTLAQHARLIDPIEGGMFQYSELGDWAHPHYEKIALVQAGALYNFADAYGLTGEQEHLRHGDLVAQFVTTTLRSREGAFYPSQNADTPDGPGAVYYALDADGRSTRQSPTVDAHIYASTNGILIGGLAHYAAAQSHARREELTGLAVRAADQLMASHRGADGLFCHVPTSQCGSTLRYLSDQVELLRAFYELYEATADRKWADVALSTATATREKLGAPDGTLYASTEDPEARGALRQRRNPVSENATYSRIVLNLARLYDRPELREEARTIIATLGSPDPLRALGRKVGEYLMALELLLSPQIVVHVVGEASDPRTIALLDAARQWVDPRKIVELAAPDASRYPYPGEPVAYMCGLESCSLPISEATDLAEAGRAFLSLETRSAF